jgi:hypothetical protein
MDGDPDTHAHACKYKNSFLYFDTWVPYCSFILDCLFLHTIYDNSMTEQFYN